MTIKRHKDFDAWKLAVEFKHAVFRLVRESRGAQADSDFRSQLIEAARAPAAHIAEGFLRKSPLVFAQYLKFGISSIGESEEHLDDGVELGYFDLERCLEIKRLAKRCSVAMCRLRDSQLRYAADLEAKRRAIPRPKRAPSSRRRRRRKPPAATGDDAVE